MYVTPGIPVAAYNLISQYDGQVVDNSGANNFALSRSDNNPIDQWPSDGGANQAWMLVPPS